MSMQQAREIAVSDTDADRKLLMPANENARCDASSPENAVLGAAILVTTAFRLRDEDALILMLRKLCSAVEALEAQTGAND